MDDLNSALIIPIILAILVVYFLPSVVAYARRHHNRTAILALNILLGSTGLGWAVALIWALTAVRPRLSSN